MDNASDDDTKERVAAFTNSSIRYHRTSKLVPVDENWTNACRLASGEFLMVVCADDRLRPGAVAKEVTALRSFPFAAAAISNRYVITDLGRRLPVERCKRGPTRSTRWDLLLRETVFAGGNIVGEPACVLFRAEHLLAQMPWSSSWSFLMDLEMYAKVLAGRDVAIVEEPLAEFRLAANSWSNALRGRQAEEFIAWVESLCERGLLVLTTAELSDVAQAAVRREKKREVGYAIARMIDRLPAVLAAQLDRI